MSMKRDIGNEETEKLLKELEKRVTKEYEQAAKEVDDKFKDYMRRFEIKDKIKREAVAAGVLDKKDYVAWRQSQVMVGERWQALVNDMARNLRNANQIAISIAQGYREDAYAINHNWETYQIESQAQINTSYTLYDRQTVERLMRDDPELLPPPKPGGDTARKLAENKALRWDRQKLSSAVSQGIIQGESVPQMTKRLESVAAMEHKAAIRNVRTMVTGAQNAGRMDAAKRARDMGIGMTHVWMATLDMRTRHEHRILDGQRREIDEPFKVEGEEIRYPGDPEAPAHLVYNCRCTLIPQVKGHEYDIRGDKDVDFSGIEGMTYDEWKKDRREKTNPITLPEEKAAAIKGSYIKEYKDLVEKTTGVRPKGGNGVEQTETDTAPKQYIKTGDLPPDQREYNDFGEYYKASNEYKGSKKYYQEGAVEFYGPDYWDYTGNEYEHVKEFNATIAQLYDDFPLPRGSGLDIGDYNAIDHHLTAIQIERKSDDAAAQCWRHPDTYRYTIGYRPATSFRTYEEELTERAEKIAKGENLIDICGASPNGIAIHEYGHALSDYISAAMIYEDETAIEYWEWYKSLSKEEIKRGLSVYAATNRAEFEAECFAELLCPNPRPLAKQYQEYLAKCMEKNYNIDGQGDPVISAISKLVPRRNVGDMPTYYLPKNEYSQVMSELATWVNNNDCPIGTMQVKRIFDETSQKNYIYYFERTGIADFRIVHKEEI